MASTIAAAPVSSDDEVVVPTIRMTCNEYSDWYDGAAGRRGEWVDGEVNPFMTTSDRHHRIHSFLFGILVNHLDLRRVGRVYSQTFELRNRQGAAREPDLLVVLDHHRDRVEEMRVRGASDLPVEIISRDSVTRDRRVTFEEYAAAGVPEIWLVDPRQGHESVQLYELDAYGRYQARVADPNGQPYKSRAPPHLARPRLADR